MEIGDNTQAEGAGLEMEHILGTPVVENDDSDKSVVEETPQKFVYTFITFTFRHVVPLSLHVSLKFLPMAVIRGD